ncbi:hypothetical protein KPH14_012826 [Odynerus spinipes]|uniref:RNase H type-1 domain-containing protein n=1 Tax=Odynerus spinipes TaxID=1348599 RepID=A0AAD9R8Q3_9HYME|nr:hypothetical protein KPH14_012826 [Odynerus spinipes]
MNNTTSKNEVILDTLEKHLKLTTNGQEVRIIWVPSHVGIIGNEAADQAAKEATSMTISESHNKLLMEDMLKMAKD